MPHPIEELTSPASWSLVRDFAVNVPGTLVLTNR